MALMDLIRVMSLRPAPKKNSVIFCKVNHVPLLRAKGYGASIHNS